MAFWLLLCFARVQLPESYVLALHVHRHTTDEAAVSCGAHYPGQFLISQQHHHCQTEQLYDVPLVLATPVVVPLLRAVLVFRTAPGLLVAPAPWVARLPAQLRGPPVAWRWV